MPEATDKDASISDPSAPPPVEPIPEPQPELDAQPTQQTNHSEPPPRVTEGATPTEATVVELEGRQPTGGQEPTGAAPEAGPGADKVDGGVVNNQLVKIPTGKTRKVPTCKHKDRTLYARGLCGPCYQRCGVYTILSREMFISLFTQRPPERGLPSRNVPERDDRS